jgi:hypothetical protein
LNTALALQLSTVLLTALLLNLPLGYLREGSARYSLRWFLYIHLSIPVVILLRMSYGLGWEIIPLTVVLAIVGQIMGGRIWRKRRS